MMLTWIKMGCGHLIAAPLLLVALFAGLAMTGTSGSSVHHILVLLAVMVIAGGVGGGILVYVWRDYLRALDEGRLYAASPAVPTASGSPDASTADPEQDLRSREAATAGEKRPASPPPPPRLPDDARPWEERDEWADGRIATSRATHDTIASGRTVLLSGGLFATIGLALLAASFWSSDPPWVLSLVFSTCGAGVMALGFYRIRRRRRFGTTTFVMHTLPGALGGPLCGMLETGVRRDEAPATGFRIQLSCYRRRVTRDSDGHRDVDRTLLWRDEKQMDPHWTASDETLHVPVVFLLPEDLPASTAEKSPTRYQWLLKASAEVPGVDYAALLEVPVFPVAPDDSAPVAAYALYERHHDADAGTRPGITVDRPAEDELVIAFGRARRPWTAVLFTALTLPLAALAWALLPNIVQALLPGLMAGLLGWGAYYYWTYRSRIRVDPTGITVQAGTPGQVSTTRFPCEELQDVEVVAAGDAYALHLHRSVRDGSPEGASRIRDVLQSLHPQTASTGASWDDSLERHGMTQDRLVAARMLTNHQEAEWLASQIEQSVSRLARRREDTIPPRSSSLP
jgi:hypothetical protein